MDPVKDWLAPKIRRRLIKKDKDCWSLKTGREGTGKSTLTIWECHYISGNRGFPIKENVVYTPDDFLTAVFNAKKGDSIQLDEGGEAWYNREFGTRINKALGKASMQIRERNLNVEICVPRWHYLDIVVLYRHNFRAHSFDINDCNGFSIYYEPADNPFSRSDVPFWNTLFKYRFVDLPPGIRATYKEIKRKKGEERLLEYIEIVRKEREKITGDAENKMSPKIIVEEIKKKNLEEKMINDRTGRIDWHKIHYYYECPQQTAQAVAAILNSE
jgi:hypothetical protein